MSLFPKISATPIAWVAQDAQLAHLCTQIHTSTTALDTEFIRVDTFYPQPGLIQMADATGQIYLLDPLALKQLDPLRAWMQDTNQLKLIHSCSEDLEVFYQWLGVWPQGLLDTQIAAAFAGLGQGMGYQRLVSQILEIHLEKGETRSDWRQRPLTRAQCDYAAQDVMYLHQVWAYLRQRLEARGYLEWCLQDCQHLVQEAQEGTSPQEAYLKVKQAWKLQGVHLYALSLLCAWREEHAREVNLPRSRLGSDAFLWEVAAHLPQHRSALTRLENTQAMPLRRYAETWLELVAQARQAPAELWPLDLPIPTSAHYKSQLQAVKKALKALAHQLDLPTELLVRKRHLTDYLHASLRQQAYTLPISWQGWRRQHLLPVLEQALQQEGVRPPPVQEG